MTMVKYENGRLKARIPYQEEICDLAMALLWKCLIMRKDQVDTLLWLDLAVLADGGESFIKTPDRIRRRIVGYLKEHDGEADIEKIC